MNFRMRFLCLFLSVILSLQGCSVISMRYHDEPGPHSAVKLYPYWEGEDGDEYLVGGLKIRLLPLDDPDTDNARPGAGREVITNSKTPVFIGNLEPGFYRLQITVDENIQVCEDLVLYPGKRLTIRIDVEGVREQEMFMDAIEDVGEAFERVFVVIGTAVLIIGVTALRIYLSRGSGGSSD